MSEAGLALAGGDRLVSVAAKVGWGVFVDGPDPGEITDPGYRAVQTIPGIGPTPGAVFVAEIGDVHRFPGRRSWRRGPG